ncbi:hypothetical protein GCM10007920_35590 [Ciceribacter naphthalenivorans]|uniref:Uncharacterized protein n=2 Tax=Alphaproteobacteria TaxID=28211 RepID=A0A512HQB9_9HYPH|nr:hypothetical protein RNA01_45800 [Ciceribacter naphthalenivorans]GLR23767.1 hypothetical protein GCM10007920_35590 [Ciceribacter naphthalenivorans]GLT06623.1 hypothetical protein GCM10007926_35590 [Sphingomonas psychrolutea]
MRIDGHYDVVVANRIDDRRAGDHSHVRSLQLIPPETFERWRPKAQCALGKHDDGLSCSGSLPNSRHKVTLALKGLIAAETCAHFKVDTTPPLR